jgi:hypothetical protein
MWVCAVCRARRGRGLRLAQRSKPPVTREADDGGSELTNGREPRGVMGAGGEVRVPELEQRPQLDYDGVGVV